MKWIDYNGLRLAVDEDQQALVLEQNVFNYERHIFEFFQRPQYVKLDGLFLDVGANYGHYLMVAKHLWGMAQSVVCVEPNFRLVDRLLMTVQENKFPNVRVMPFAASDEWRTVYCNAAKITWDNGNVFCVEAEEPSYNCTQAQSARLDDLVYERVAVVKLDVEGFEYKALRGMQKVLEWKPTVVFEFCPEVCHRSGVSPATLLQFFLDRGYTLEVLPYHEGMGGVFTEAEAVIAYVKETSKWICDLAAVYGP